MFINFRAPHSVFAIGILLMLSLIKCAVFQALCCELASDVMLPCSRFVQSIRLCANKPVYDLHIVNCSQIIHLCNILNFSNTEIEKPRALFNKLKITNGVGL